MKTRQRILATAVGLLAASPFLAFADYGEGTMWTDLLALRSRLAAQPSAMAVEVGPRRIYQNLYEETAARQTQAAGMAGRSGPEMEKQGRAPTGRFDTRGEVSIYEQLAESQGDAAGT